METLNEERTPFEIGVVVPKRIDDQIGEGFVYDCVEVVINEFQNIGLIVDRVVGLHDEFIKLAAPVEVIGKAAAESQLKKRTRLGVDLQFQLNEAEAFTRQTDGSLFSWNERFRCYNHMIYGIVNKSGSTVILKSNCRDIRWEPGESLVQKLEKEAIVKEVFPIHDELKRKRLLKSWALNWWDLTNQPLDEVYAYYGAKIATYFAFLGMYTNWLFFAAAFGILVQSVNFRSLQFVVLPFFFICILSWAALFLQFWKRKNSVLLARWHIGNSVGAESAYEYNDTEWSSSVELIKKSGADKSMEKEKIQREEWSGHVLRFKHDAIIILNIIGLQLPFELAYAHLYESIGSDIMKFGMTAVYLYAIQYFTQKGGKKSVKLIKDEKNKNSEYKANSLVYKVFGLYFMQTYIGLLYHAIMYRDFTDLRHIIIQRLIVSEVLEIVIGNLLPYIKYSYRKYKAVNNKRKQEKGVTARKSYLNSRVEKEYLKPKFSASVGEELEDGLFDEFLELALQFGMIMMFACAFPSAFAFAALSSVTQIRANALKLLAMYRRPAPRVAATIGAWLNIFQFLIVVSICTNCMLLVCLYDKEGKWNISPGLAAILIVEHVLLLIKFGFSKIVPEEPDWVKANRLQNANQAQNICYTQLMGNVPGGRTLDSNYV
ncbi:anoctamin-like protein At1g73020 isoform X2 [Bidens hawaiensis]|uniref:anoctamin-like protein At1g73020 isoform X2 n=1 Tax=Bidens hawaiensis TaxID=980011 RepID=UPI004049C44A